MSTISSSTTSTTAYKVTADTTGTLVIQTGSTPTTAVTIDTSQNVGIGTSSPTNKFDVVGNIGLNNSNAIKFKNNAGTYQNTVTWDSGDNILIGDSSNSTNTILKLYAGSASGQILFYGNNTERMRIDNNANLQYNSGYGSVATAYGCRAWVNFNGSSASIRSSGNVTSVTRNGTGDYTVNFTSAMPDANYSFTAFCKISTAGVSRTAFANGDNGNTTQSASSYRFYTTNLAGTPSDTDFVNVAIFR